MGCVPYRPSNGTEGDCFQNRWCCHCVDYPPDMSALGAPDPCPILLNAMALAVDDPDYPAEWRQDGPKGPRCTAFRENPDDPAPLDPAAVIRPLL